MGKEKVIVREIDHTADYGVRVTASHLSLLFEKMAEILSSAMVDLSGVADNRKKTLSFKENDLESLMMSWLSELLFLFEVKNLIFKK
ncbi:MAG: archease [bacterium]